MGNLAGLRSRIVKHTAENLAGAIVLAEADLDDFIGAALERMQQLHDWVGQQTETSVFLSYGAGDDGVALPSDFVQELAVYDVDETTFLADPLGSRRPIPKLQGGRAAWMERLHASDETSRFPRPSLTGRWYFIWAGKLFIVGTLGATTIKVAIDYWGTLAEIAGGDGTQENYFTRVHFHTVKWGALWEAYSFLHEAEHATMAEAMFMKLLEGSKKRDNSLKASGGSRVRGT